MQTSKVSVLIYVLPLLCSCIHHVLPSVQSHPENTASRLFSVWSVIKRGHRQGRKKTFQKQMTIAVQIECNIIKAGAQGTVYKRLEVNPQRSVFCKTCLLQSFRSCGQTNPLTFKFLPSINPETKLPAALILPGKPAPTTEDLAENFHLWLVAMGTSHFL